MLLPVIAEHRVRDTVGRYGSVKSATVTACPAVKLLWGDVDEVRSGSRRYEADARPARSPRQLVAEAHGATKVDVRARRSCAREGPLVLTQDVYLRKRGGAM